MFNKNLRTALMGAGAVVALTAGPALAGQTDDLQSQIQSLQSRLDQLEKQQATDETKQVAAPADAVVGGDFPGSFKLPGADTSYAIHGYAKLGFAYDQNQNVGDAYIPENFSVNNSQGGNHSWHFGGYANQSNLHIETRTPTDYGQMKTVMEFDWRTSSDVAFNGNNVASGSSQAAANDPTGKGIARLRLAYGVLGPVEAGKDYDLMQNDFASSPEHVDYWGPQGPSYGARVPLLRYTQGFGKLTLAGELNAPAATGAGNPSFNSEQGYFTAGTVKVVGATQAATNPTGSMQYSNMPEFAGAADYADTWGHVALRGKVRELHVESAGGSNFLTPQNNSTTAANYTLTTYGYIGYIGGNLNTGQFIPALGKDSLAGALIWGVGSSEDMSGTDDQESASVINFGGTGAKITATPMHGFQVNYRHWWTNTIRSNVMWGLTQFSPSHDNSTLASGAAAGYGTAAMTTQAQTVWANVIWSPVSTVNFGLEYLWGEVHHQNYINGAGQSLGNANGIADSGGYDGYTGYGSDQRVELGMQYLF